MKTCKSCTMICKFEDVNECKYVRLEKGDIKINCSKCDYRINNWCKLHEKSYNAVMFKCIGVE